jgi:hypothetical protein
MSAYSGPGIPNDGLVFSIDAGNKKSSIRSTQQNNILVDPHTWTVGTGGFTGYGANGDATEQNRTLITDDPWGGTSIVWATTPDAASGADGGWNTSYYTIDQNSLYRYAVWVRRHTAGTGGTFYFGMNPSPVRNDNSAVQGNPYFCYPAQSSLALNQWYLVVAHCFPQSYTGGRHPDSGWYANGSKISDIAFGNVGSADVRWNPGTTSAGHRTYHFYTTNTASGLQFAYPRIDLCDGNEPSISDLLNTGESVINNTADTTYVDKIKTINLTTFDYDNLGSFSFNGSSTYLDLQTDVIISPTNQGWTAMYWFNTSSASTLQHFNSAEADDFNANWLAIYNSKLAVWNVSPGYWRYGSTTIQSNTWYQAVFVCDAGGTNMRYYINGIQEGGDHVGNSWSSPYSAFKTRYVGRYEYAGGYSRYFVGNISNVQLYTRALSAAEVRQNFNALRGRYGV